MQVGASIAAMTNPQAAAPLPAPEADRDGGLAQGLLGGDWPVRAADTIERVVDQVRSKTTGPAIIASRWIVYGLVAAFLGGAALLLLLIGLIRGLNVAIPGDVWIIYLILGVAFTVVGALLWRKRSTGAAA